MPEIYSFEIYGRHLDLIQREVDQSICLPRSSYPRT